MSGEQLALFAVVVAFAGYFQTVTGFGLGMIIIGAVAGFGIAPVAMIAAAVSMLAVVNCAVALPGRLQHLDRSLIVPLILGIVPAIAAGLVLLAYLSATATNVLRTALGALVIYGGISTLKRTRPGQSVSSAPSFALAGVCGGLCGGLFGISGPPLIYQLYRQPIDLVGIRNTLILCFAVTSSMRVVMLAVSGQIDIPILTLTVIALPIIVLTTWLGRRFPPPLSPHVLRRLVCGVLVAIGCQLIVSAGIA